MKLKKGLKKTLTMPKRERDGSTTYTQAELTEKESAAIEWYKELHPEITSDEEALAMALRDIELGQFPGDDDELPWWKEFFVQLIFLCVCALAILIPATIIIGFKLSGIGALAVLGIWFGGITIWNRWMTGLWLWQQ